MEIIVRGTRGSIPAPGKDTVIYGGNTTCIEIKPIASEEDVIIIDAGSGIRKLGLSLLKDKKIKHIHLFLTHSHWDHIQGFPFFVPAYIPTYNIHIYGCPPAYTKLQEILSDQMEYRYFPVNFNELSSNISFHNFCESQLEVAGIKITTIENNHPGTAWGLKFMENSKTFVFMTDNELNLTPKSPNKWIDYVKFIKGADIFFHDAQYTEEEMPNKIGWGHSSFEQAFKLAVEGGVKNLFFFHHDPERTDKELKKIVRTFQKKIDEKNLPLKCYGAAENTIIEL